MEGKTSDKESNKFLLTRSKSEEHLSIASLSQTKSLFTSYEKQLKEVNALTTLIGFERTSKF